MRDTLLFCENRNKFYKGESKNSVTLWTKEAAKAEKFYSHETEATIDHLKRSIFDHKHIKAVGIEFKPFN